MKKTLIALAVAGVASFGASAFAADVSVTFDPGIVAYGYTDGYWTRNHEWRTWEKPEYVEVYRKHPGARYYDWVHTRDANQGWIEIK